MEDHRCPFAEAIGQSVKFQTDDDGLTVCAYCHAPKNPAVTKTVTKTLRK